EQRGEQRNTREHRGRQDEARDQRLAAEVHAGQRVGGEHTHRERNRGGRGANKQRVADRPEEVIARVGGERVPEVLHRQVAGQRVGGEGVAFVAQGGDHHPVERREPPRQDHDDGEVVAQSLGCLLHRCPPVAAVSTVCVLFAPAPLFLSGTSLRSVLAFCSSFFLATTLPPRSLLRRDFLGLLPASWVPPI